MSSELGDMEAKKKMIFFVVLGVNTMPRNRLGISEWIFSAWWINLK
jgi:hypothetical protein